MGAISIQFRQGTNKALILVAPSNKPGVRTGKPIDFFFLIHRSLFHGLDNRQGDSRPLAFCFLDLFANLLDQVGLGIVSVLPGDGSGNAGRVFKPSMGTLAA